MEMQFKNEIKKLADVVVWADNGIEEMRMDLSSLTEEEFKNLDAVKDLEAVKKVVLESIERHTVYTNSLNKDIADKAAKIELLEKEIEGRKEGYWALKEQYDNVTASKENWRASTQELVETCKSKNEEIENLKKELEGRKKTIKILDEKVERQKENLDGINRTLEIRTKEKESLVKVRNNLNKEIEAHESENARLTEKIVELKKERDKQMARVNDLRMELDCVKASKEKHEEAAHDKVVEDLRESFNYWRTECLAAQEEKDALQKELNESYKAWDLDSKNHSKRDMTLVDELAKKNDEIKKLKEENLQLSAGRVDTDFVNKLIQETDYYKNQERIRTDQLRATESKVEKLYKQIEGLTNNCRSKSTEIARLRKEMADIRHELKQKQDMIKTAYERYSNEVIKTRKDLMEVAYRDIEKDNGYVGFKLYVKSALIEAKGDKNEANEIITEAVRSAYTEWGKEQKEEETEVKGVGRTSSGRYPWGAKVNDIPCGEDAIE